MSHIRLSLCVSRRVLSLALAYLTLSATLPLPATRAAAPVRTKILEQSSRPAQPIARQKKGVGQIEPLALQPNGKIAFVSMRDGNEEIYVMDADGGNQINLTNNAADDREPAWSPDGKKIAFSTLRDVNAEIYVMDADGSNVTNVSSHAANDAEPTREALVRAADVGLFIAKRAGRNRVASA